MAGVKVVNAQGEEGNFNPIEFLRKAVDPNVTIKNIDTASGIIKYQTGQGEGELNVPEYLGSSNVKITGIEDAVNTPEDAVDSSPLSFMERSKLGLVTREAPQVKRLLNALGSMVGAGNVVPMEEQDIAETTANKGRILAALKGQYDDVRFVNGEAKLKKQGVWYNANAEGLDRGDIAELLGQSGLNIAGSIAAGASGALLGAPAGPVGAVAGGAIGSIVGALSTEAVEEALAIGISDGKVDVNAALQDMTTEGLFGAFGEGAGALISKTAGLTAKALKGGLTKEASEEITKTMADDVLSKNISGMKNIQKNASSATKDFMAKAVSTLNAEVSEPVVRAALDNADEVAKNIKINRAVPQDAVNPLNTKMQDLFESGIDAAQSQFDNAYERIKGVVRSTLDRGPSAFQIDLNEMAAYLAKQGENIADETAKNSLKTAERFVQIQASKAGENAKLSGAKAFDFIDNLDNVVDDQMRKLGLFSKRKERSAVDQSIAKGMFDVSDFLGSKLDTAYRWANLDKVNKQLGDAYRETRAGFRVLKRKFYADTNKVKFLEDVAKGQNDDFTSAMASLDNAMGQISNIMPLKGKVFNSTELLQNIRLLQAGKELSPLFTLPKGKAIPVALGAAALAAAKPGAAPLAAAALSPRFGYWAAKNAVKGASIASIPIDAAREQARRIMTVAQASGMLNKLNPADKIELLKDSQALEAIYQTVGRVASEQVGQNQRVMDAAMKRADGQEGQP